LLSVPDLPAFKVFWQVARADSFAEPPTVLSMRGSKSQ
jgi:hypothetical protein